MHLFGTLKTTTLNQEMCQLHFLLKMELVEAKTKKVGAEPFITFTTSITTMTGATIADITTITTLPLLLLCHIFMSTGT